ncbi:hypothetical protein AJ79_06523 [Helicocarpus griseus UAMH5409]|uniref:Uncharacterized protein n=1 Tax=Helicocarpus griseus UAMH5409 TaxID=1447875 RepID=A0A2B7XCH0_9EURO|nr:hypothetical protein AJ79_06523 [Helicocarpus griseus UAMH5409]
MAKKRSRNEKQGASANLPVAQSLSEIPTELVHQVLEDLTIYNILVLASHNIPQLDDRIFSFLIHKRLLEHKREEEDFSILKRYFRVYREIFTSLGLPKASTTSPLSTGISTQVDSLCDAVRWYLHLEILGKLRVSARFAPLLKSFAQSDLEVPNRFSTPGGIESYWGEIKDVQKRLNDTKAAQLRRMAEIFKTYPDLLCRTTDKRQVVLKNVDHVVRRFQVEAEKTAGALVLRRSQYGPKSLPSSYMFWPNLFPIAPLNKTLKLFLKGIGEFPPLLGQLASTSYTPGSEKRVEEALSLLQISSGTLDNELDFSTITPSKPTAPYHDYPPQTLQDIRTAIEGLEYVYMPPAVRAILADARVPRTKYTLYSVLPPNEHQPHFAMPDAVLRRNASRDDRVLKQLEALKGTPHDEREFTWLESFLRCCRYLQELGVNV